MNKCNQSSNKGFFSGYLKTCKYSFDAGFPKIALVFLLAVTIFFLGCKKTPTQVAEEGEEIQAPPETTINAASGDEFTIVAIPDMQYYAEQYGGGTEQMFKDQIDWIKTNRVSQNIVYVAGLGDIVDNGDLKAGSPPTDNIAEWNRASYFYQLETPMPGLPHGIPYGLAVGNHDQTFHGYPIINPNNTTQTTKYYNQFFGVSHFAGRAYYGESYTVREANNNDSHYDLFSAGGLDFIVICLEYDQEVNQYGSELEGWAYNLLGTYASRKAIVVMHALGTPNGTPGTNYGEPSGFYTKALATYNRIKSRKNVFLMLGGHTGSHYAEGYRQDTYDGKTIKSITSNYQWLENGGNGYMRLMKFSVANDLISVRTYSPSLNTFETDGDSQFNKSLFHEATTTRICDFDNDGKTELTLFESGVWKVDGLADVAAYGNASGDIPVPGDYDGDGKTENAYWQSYPPFRWYLPTMPNTNFGVPGAIPVPADYTGDGRTDLAYWTPANGEWKIKMTNVFYVSSPTSIPVPADYDGDGKADIAVYDPNTGNWQSRIFATINTGGNGAIPVPGDYNGDGKVDVAYFRPADKKWYINDQTTVDLSYYQSGDIPAPGDYDGDGDTDPALYRPSARQLIIYNGPTVTISSATSAFKLVNLPYHIRKFFFP